MPLQVPWLRYCRCGPAGAVPRWRLNSYMDEHLSTATADSSGLGNNADFVGDPCWIIGHNAASAGAIQFNGTAYLEVDHADSLELRRRRVYPDGLGEI